MLDRAGDWAGDWAALLDRSPEERELDRIRKYARSGHPMGTEDWVIGLERETGRQLRPGLPGRPRKAIDQVK